MAKARVELDEDLHAALSIQATKARASLKEYVGSLLLPAVDKATWDFLGVDPSDKSVVGEPSAKAEKKKITKDNLTKAKRIKKPPLLDSDSRKQQLIEMVKQPEPATLEEMGARLGGYDKGAVSRAISRLRESGELQEGGEESTS